MAAASAEGKRVMKAGLKGKPAPKRKATKKRKGSDDDDDEEEESDGDDDSEFEVVSTPYETGVRTTVPTFTRRQ